MKAIKILCLTLAVLMLACSFAACGGNSDTTPAETTEAVKHDPITVQIVVKDSLKGNVVYQSDSVLGYKFEGAVATPLAILEEFMSFENDVELVYDADGKLSEVGTLKATTGHLWLWALASAPKGADDATPMDANIDAYSNIKNGDTIVIYLS